jgi:hypothetical protein
VIALSIAQHAMTVAAHDHEVIVILLARYVMKLHAAPVGAPTTHADRVVGLEPAQSAMFARFEVVF